MVYSDSTPCVVTVQKDASRYKQRVQREREIAALSLRDPLSLLAYAQNFRPFLSLENPLSLVSRLPRLFPIALSFFFPSRCFAIPRPPQKGKDRSFPGKASPPVRWSGVVTTTSMGNDPACCRSRYARRHGTLRNRVGDPRAPSHLRTAGATAAFTFSLQSFHHKIKPPGRTKEKKNAPPFIRRMQISKQGCINRSITLGPLTISTRGETPAIASNPELLGL
jgi:hypothetical protein